MNIKKQKALGKQGLFCYPDGLKCIVKHIYVLHIKM